MKTSAIQSKLASIGVAGVMLLASQAVMGQAGPPDRPPGPPEHRRPLGRPGKPQTTQVSGTVQSYNLGPRGNVEGLMIKTGEGIAQVNLPPEFGPIIEKTAAVGAQVQITAIPQPGMPDHPVYDFYSMNLERSRQLKLPSPEDRKFVHIDGTVKSLNYGHRGEVNGAILDNGDFVQLGPEAHELNLPAGTKLVVDGVATPMLASEQRVIQAVAINGKVVQPPPGMAGRPGRGAVDQQRPPLPGRARRGAPPGAEDGQAPPPPPDADGPRRGPRGQAPPPPPPDAE